MTEGSRQSQDHDSHFGQPKFDDCSKIIKCLNIPWAEQFHANEHHHTIPMYISHNVEILRLIQSCKFKYDTKLQA